MKNINLWQIGFMALMLGILLTTIPIIFAFRKKIKLDKPKFWFKEADFLGDLRVRLIATEGRIQGTLIYWKNQAAAHRILHTANIFWGLIASVSLPVLVQFYDKNDAWASSFMTVMTFWTGLIFAISYTLKSESKYQGFRATESDFYDITRQLLDTPERDEEKLEQLVNDYIKTVEEIRKMARRIETGIPPSVRL
ncbi:MAG: hypothetical protein V4539_01185 [Bacteroidota bacterium]